MSYKQVIVVNKELGMSIGKTAAQVSHASMAFLTKAIQSHSKILNPNKHNAWKNKEQNIPQLYKRKDLDDWAREARENGDDYFYCKPQDLDKPYGNLVKCTPDEYQYSCEMTINKDLYEQWMGGIFTKVILEAKNESQMKKIVEKAKDAGMIEDSDFFCIRDACLTELTPDETGTRWTCIGFVPMDSESIDSITKRLQLYKN